MTIFRIALIAAVMFLSKSTVGEKPTSRAETNPRPVPVASTAQFEPIFVFPERYFFVTYEDDPLLISVEAFCPPGLADTAQFELLPPTPDFVKIRSTSRGYGISHALIEVWPGRRDAGKYTVLVRWLNCVGKGGTFSLRVKVKP